MAHTIRARLVAGQPCLQLIDADACCVRMAFNMPQDRAEYDPLAARDFFRELMLCDLGESLKLKQRKPKADT